MNESRRPAQPGVDIRCHYGKLVVQWQGQNLVIKCARCRRSVQIHASAITASCNFQAVGKSSNASFPNGGKRHGHSSLM